MSHSQSPKSFTPRDNSDPLSPSSTASRGTGAGDTHSSGKDTDTTSSSGSSGGSFGSGGSSGSYGSSGRSSESGGSSGGSSGGGSRSSGKSSEQDDASPSSPQKGSRSSAQQGSSSGEEGDFQALTAQLAEIRNDFQELAKTVGMVAERQLSGLKEGAEQAVQSLKERAGDLSEHTRSSLESAKAQGEEVWHYLQDHTDATVQQMEKTVARNPFTAIAISVLAGFILGVATRK